MFEGQPRCIVGDLQIANGTQSRLCGLAVIVDVKKDIKRDGWVSCFIICHCGKKKRKNSNWHLKHDNFISFITLATPMFEKQ